jgi:MFS family permease
LAYRTDGILPIGLYFLYLGLGVFAGAIVVVGITTAKELFPVRIAGTAVGLANFFPFLGGALFQPILGYVLEEQGRNGDAFTLEGYRQCFLILLSCAAVAFLSTFFLKESLRQE